ncbi:MAG: RNA polymerase sigma factor [Alistipes sp.]|nr:RNA polymerase sigma factor [Alistipes sp.]
MKIDNKSIVPAAGGVVGQAGFSALIDTYTEQLYWHIRRMVVVHEDAQDILQEMWIRAYRHIGSYKGSRAEIHSWLYKIATNLCLRHLKRKYERRFIFFGDEKTNILDRFSECISEPPDSVEARFQKALLSLPTKQRTVFNLRYYDELPYAEISRITGMSETTLKTNYHYAQQRIKELMTR